MRRVVLARHTLRSRPVATAVAAFALAATPAFPAEPYPGLVVFGRDASELEAFFQSRACLVGPLRSIERSADGVTAVIVYPSSNAGYEEAGSTVIYSHRVRVSEPGGDAPGLDAIDHGRHAVVLAPEAEGERYRLVGLLEHPPGETTPWDYFADKPALWYRSTAP